MDSMEQVLAQGKDASDVRRIPDVTREETSLAQDELSLGGFVLFCFFHSVGFREVLVEEKSEG